ncbi:MAG: hypothetical protein IKB34_00415 [Clostridia bacterium]|nr:hypothetical protein [Clostridia bacterium]
MKKKILTAIEIVFGVASLVALIFNISLIVELIESSKIADPDFGEGLGRAFALVFLIIFVPVMTGCALVRWLIYTPRAVKRRGKGKTFLIQFPFFVVFLGAILMIFINQIGSENIIPTIFLSVIGGLGGMFIFADIDLYKAPFTLGKAPKVSNTDDTVPAEAETDKNSDSDAQ